MSEIRAIYHQKPDGSRQVPNFPATDQHPSAARYPFDHPTRGLLNVDATGGAPSQAEIDAVLGLDAAGQTASARLVVDEQERLANKVDTQIISDMNMTAAEVNTTVDTVFAGFTAGQRTFLKRLVRMLIACARKVLR